MTITRPEIMVGSVGLAVLIVLAVMTYVWRRPKRLKVENYIGDWKQLQAFCKNKTTWPNALTDADKLLDKALKRRKYKGKRMGERLAAAQHQLTDNDAIWIAHKLTKKLIENPSLRLRESQVKTALIAYRQALIDLGALPNAKSKNT